MTKGYTFLRSGNCKHRYRSAMSNSAWCDLGKNCTVLKLHDMCHNQKGSCQKQITFTPEQFQIEKMGFKKTTKKYSKELRKCGIFSLNQD